MARLGRLLLALGGGAAAVAAFQVRIPSPPTARDLGVRPGRTPTALGGARQRKAKVQKTGKSRPNSFLDEVAEMQRGQEEQPPAPAPGADGAGPLDDDDFGPLPDLPPAAADARGAEADRRARMQDAVQKFEARPEVSTVVYDEEAGKRVLVQGKNVMDVVTRRAVQLSPLGAEFRLAQMFPGVPPEVRARHRLDWAAVDDAMAVVEAFRAASSVRLADGARGLPPHPSVAGRAIDFLLANRDRLGREFDDTLGRLTLRAYSQFNQEEGAAYRALWKHYMTLENHISAPFRQMILDAEGRMGPNFGNLDLMSYCNGELYERCANYLVLKGMVAHWEKKVLDADLTEKTPRDGEEEDENSHFESLSIGDPKRFLPNPTILFTLRECTQVCLMAQNITQRFVATPELVADFPPELKFLEAALNIRGGTGLRQFMVEEFCPAEGVTPEALREGMRRLLAQLENLQLDPYADICNLLEGLIDAMARGAAEEPDSPFERYVADPDEDCPGSFQTYTFDDHPLSIVRLIDSQIPEDTDDFLSEPPELGFNLIPDAGITPLVQPAPDGEEAATTAADGAGAPAGFQGPASRALDRPHELGWWDLLFEQRPEERSGPPKPVPAGRIIPDEEAL